MFNLIMCCIFSFLAGSCLSCAFMTDNLAIRMMNICAFVLDLIVVLSYFIKVN